MKKKNRKEPEPQHEPEILTSFIKYEDLRCIGQQISRNPKTDFEVQMNMMKLLVSTNHHGLEDMDRDELWSIDLDTGECLPAGGPENEKPPFLDKLKESGGHSFLLCRRGDGKFHIPVTGPIRIWNVNNLPPSLNKFFEMVPEGFEGIEFTGYDFDPKNYSLLLFKNLNQEGERP